MLWKNLREEIDASLARDPAARSRLEVALCYPGFHALVCHRLAHWLWRRRWLLAGRFVSFVARAWTGIEIHPGARIGRGVFIDHGMGVVIGETAVIGTDCTLYQGVTLGGTSWIKGKRHPTLGDNVVIGAGAKILGPVTIGDGARVGSNAVVVKDVPAGATAIGIPARILGKEQREKGGFSAYAVGSDMNDPTVKAIHELIDHSVNIDRRIDQILEQLKRAGVKCEAAAQRDTFDPNYLNKIVD